jgi:hypothetical protein
MDVHLRFCQGSFELNLTAAEDVAELYISGAVWLIVVAAVKDDPRIDKLSSSCLRSGSSAG